MFAGKFSEVKDLSATTSASRQPLGHMPNLLFLKPQVPGKSKQIKYQEETQDGLQGQMSWTEKRTKAEKRSFEGERRR